MEPVFTLPWPEFSVINELAKYFTQTHGYTFYVPVSRQEKGIDFILLKRQRAGEHKEFTFQVKASRDYPDRPRVMKNGTEKFAHGGWFKKYNIDEYADFHIFVIHYLDVAPETSVKANTPKHYKPCILIFDRMEIRELLGDLKQKKNLSKDESNFYFRFNNSKEVRMTRGRDRVVTPQLLENCKNKLMEKMEK